MYRWNRSWCKHARFSLTVQNAVPLSQLGVASASSQLFRSLGNTIGIGIFGIVMSSRMATKMNELLFDSTAAGYPTLASDQAKQMSELLNPQILLDQPKLEQTLNQMPLNLRPTADQMVTIVREVFSDALTTVFLSGAIIMLIAVIIALFIKSIPLVSASDKFKPDPEKSSHIKG